MCRYSVCLREVRFLIHLQFTIFRPTSATSEVCWSLSVPLRYFVLFSSATCVQIGFLKIKRRQIRFLLSLKYHQYIIRLINFWKSNFVLIHFDKVFITGIFYRNLIGGEIMARGDLDTGSYWNFTGRSSGKTRFDFFIHTLWDFDELWNSWNYLNGVLYYTSVYRV